MRHDTPVGFWPVRLLPMFAGLLGLSGLLAARGPVAVIAGMLLVAALALELVGWGQWVRTRARSLGVATLAGACVCAIALVAVSVGGSNAADSVIAHR